MDEKAEMNVIEEINTVKLLCDKIQNIKNLKKSKNEFKERTNKNRSVDSKLNKSNQQLNKNKSVDQKASNIKHKSILKSYNIKPINEELPELKTVKDKKETAKAKIVVEGMLSRFQKNENDKKDKFKEMQKKVQEKEFKDLKAKPTINEKSKKIKEKENVGFLERMLKQKEDAEIKRNELIDKENLKKQIKDQLLLDEIQLKQGKKYNKAEMDKKIKQMFGKDIEVRTSKEINKTNNIDKDCTFKPNINKTNCKLKEKNNNLNENNLNIEKKTDFVERLYNQDIIKRNCKQKIADKLYYRSINGDFYLETEKLKKRINNNKINDDLFVNSDDSSMSAESNVPNGLEFEIPADLKKRFSKLREMTTDV